MASGTEGIEGNCSLNSEQKTYAIYLTIEFSHPHKHIFQIYIIKPDFLA